MQQQILKRLEIIKNGKIIFLETKGKHLLENFKIKERYFKNYIKDKLKYKLLVSENDNIVLDDKQWVLGEIKNEL